MQIVSADEKSAMSKQDMIQAIKAYVQEARTLNRQKTGMEEHVETESAHEEQDEDKQPGGVEEDGESEDQREEQGIGDIDSIFTLFTSVCMKQMTIKKSVC